MSDVSVPEAVDTIVNFANRRRDVDPIAAARDRTSSFVHNISMAPLLELQKRQDELSNAIARIEKSEEALVHYIGEFAARCAEAEKLATDIKPIIETAVSPFRRDPPATLTLQSNEGESK